jgi:hypothetical protein
MDTRMGSAVGARVDKKTAVFFLSALFWAATLPIGNPAFAQVSGTNILLQSSPLGTTSPLGVGPEMPVAPTGITLGATELSSPGLSPTLGPMIGGSSSCSGGRNSMSRASTSAFDGGGFAGTASGTCSQTNGSTSAGPASSGSLPDIGSASSVGGAGIPLGATELGVGGVSGPPIVLNPDNTDTGSPSDPL